MSDDWVNPNKGSKRPGKGGIKTLEGRARQIAATKSVAFAQTASERAKRQWQDPAFVQAQMRARRVRPNKLEIAFEESLTRYGFHYVGDGDLIVDGKCPDYWDGGTKLIELYDDYWHAGQDPNERIDRFRKHGYETLIIWESQLKNSADVVFAQVEEFVGNATAKVLSIRREHFRGVVYNLEVEEDNSYSFVEAVSHNCMQPVNQDARFSIINKAITNLGLPATTLNLQEEYAMSALCRDGSCSIDNSDLTNLHDPNAERALYLASTTPRLIPARLPVLTKARIEPRIAAQQSAPIAAPPIPGAKLSNSRGRRR